MLKNTLSVAAATIAVIASASLPAAATGLGDILGQANTPARVPEPSTILGTLVVGGIGLISTKKKDAQSNEEQK
uniref:PEP-CTERM sorting domain-containing protein n=1 Tax=Okeania sp. SIO2F4 TaxID=2607790 RepID=UPI0025FDB8B0|nr:PEP-CTERM sorting domain-containing protein [Okeania sp. SIO2F4]